MGDDQQYIANERTKFSNIFVHEIFFYKVLITCQTIYWIGLLIRKIRYKYSWLIKKVLSKNYTDQYKTILKQYKADV